MKRGPTSSAIRGMQMKSTMRCHNTPIRIAKIKMAMTSNTGKKSENWNVSPIKTVHKCSQQVYNTSKLETTQIFLVSGCLNCSISIPRNKKEWTIDISNNLDRSQGNYAEWQKANNKG